MAQRICCSVAGAQLPLTTTTRSTGSTSGGVKSPEIIPRARRRWISAYVSPELPIAKAGAAVHSSRLDASAKIAYPLPLYRESRSTA